MKKMKLFLIIMICLITLTGCFTSSASEIKHPSNEEVNSIVKKFRGLISWNIFDETLVRSNLDNIFICYDNGDMVALLRITMDNPKVVHVNDLVTLPDKRGKGYAKSLIEHVVNNFPRASLRLTPTKKAIAFYQNCGFLYDSTTNIAARSPS